MQTEIKEKNGPTRRGILRVLLTTTALIATGIVVGTLAGKLPLMRTAIVFAGILALWLSCLRPALALILFFCGIVMMTDAFSAAGTNCFAIPDVDIMRGLPSVSTIFFLFLFCITMARVFFFERRALPVSPYGLGVYAAILLLSLLVGVFRGSVQEMIRVDFMKMFFPVLCYYLCITILNSRRRIEHMLIVLLVISALKSIILAGFYIEGRGWPYATYRVATLDSADLLVFITLVLIVLHLLVRRDLRGFKAGLAAMACLPMLFVILCAYRRAQWIGLFFSLGLLYLGSTASIRRRLVFIPIIALCFASAFAVIAEISKKEETPRIASRLLSIFDEKQSSNLHHKLEAQQVARDLCQSPLVGFGLGGHHRVVAGFDTIPTNIVHNTFLYVWMKLGLSGLVFFIWAAFLYARRIFQMLKTRRQDEIWGLLLPLAASSGLWLAMFLTGPVPWYFHQTFLLALFAAMGMSLVLQTERDSTTQAEVPL